MAAARRAVPVLTPAATGGEAPAAPVVVFDTDCVLCSRVVRFILAHGRDAQLRFAGAWSPEGHRLAAAYGFSAEDLDETFLVIRDGRALTRSAAAFAVMAHLRAPWHWLRILAVLPRPIRDGLYGIVARHRYRWFGRRESCARVPAERIYGGLGTSATPMP